MDALKFEGISVATVGPALGHAMMVDDVTLSQAEAAGVAGSPVKVFVDHDESIDSLIGFLANFRIVEDQLRADLELLGSHPQATFYSEILTKAPNRVGFSMTFSGTPDEQDGKRFARVSELVSVDLVSRPAANPDGVFRAGSEPEAKDMMHEDFQHPQVDTAEEGMGNPAPIEKVEFDAQAAIESLAASVADLKSTVDGLAAAKEETPAPVAAPVDSEMAAKLDAAMSKLSALEVELAARGDNAITGNGSAVSVEDAYASGDRATKFEIVRKALEASDFSLINKLKQSK
jgi:hypothetical protein